MQDAKVCELELGDVVKVNTEFYSHATVIDITEKEITLFRPYVHTSGFKVGTGIIPYIGMEQWKISKTNENITVVHRRTNKIF